MVKIELTTKVIDKNMYIEFSPGKSREPEENSEANIFTLVSFFSHIHKKKKRGEERELESLTETQT